MIVTTLGCLYCKSTFKTAAGADKHRCKKKVLAEEVGDASLRRAYVLFDFWFRYNGFSKKAKTAAEFQRSPHFDLFVRLDKRATSLYLGSAIEYLRWLTDRRIPSGDWFKDDVAVRYRSEVSKAEDAVTATIRSLEHMSRFCDKNGASLQDFFAIVGPAELAIMVETGRVSPWILICTNRLMDLLDRVQSEAHLEHLAIAFDSDYWHTRTQLAPDKADEVRSILRQVGL